MTTTTTTTTTTTPAAAAAAIATATATATATTTTTTYLPTYLLTYYYCLAATATPVAVTASGLCRPATIDQRAEVEVQILDRHLMRSVQVQMFERCGIKL